MITFITKNKYLKGAVSAAVLLSLWWLAAVLVAEPIILPTPADVLVKLCSLAATADFWASVLLSMLRVLGGYLLGVVLGVLLAVAAAKSNWLNALISPVISIVTATPVTSFIMLAYFWFKSDNSLTVFICALMVMPIIFGNVCKGYQQLDNQLLEVGSVFGFGLFKRARYIIIPGVMPFAVSGAVTSLALAWKAGIAAEILCQPIRSIGLYIYDAKVYLQTDSMFAWTAVVIVLSMLLRRLLNLIGGRLLSRYNFGGDADVG